MSAISLIKADFIITCDLQPTSLKAFHYRQAARSSQLVTGKSILSDRLMTLKKKSWR